MARYGLVLHGVRMNENSIPDPTDEATVTVERAGYWRTGAEVINTDAFRILRA